MLSEQSKRMIEANTDCDETLQEAYSALMTYLGCELETRPAEVGCNTADYDSGHGIFGHNNAPVGNEIPREDGGTLK